MKQPDLFACASTVLPDHEVAWLINYLRGKDWRTATQILVDHGQPNHESAKRRVRELASGSNGRIAGGQGGYKLVAEMTKDEYDHWRNAITSQADEMRRRVIISDKVYYSRSPIAAVVPGPLPKFDASSKTSP